MSLIAKRQCLFCSFNATEALQYLSKQNVSLDFETASKTTYLNPLLLSAILPGVKFSLEIQKSIDSQIILYVRNLLYSLVHFDVKKSWLQK